ncbi:DUF262 domain-containing protein [Actinokineospora sp. NBRC 105648]|uniref:DUF262 domain-containing protein n=1 Tax=Actinokineospora sp. NBRC 105648 TaxID=3032206 RepID=UPI0024A4E804|nr:DUF262 domain-containing protein [Actinokineospora sp. NBRC 105648]GLZ41165.1 hypothetical protein Acsp05_47890 [Actinokineospora sp. NBRC 105648]
MSAGLDTKPNAVTFDLEDLVEQAWVGHIRIPHFQRPFRWGRDDVARLFDSVLKGYPIGSVLLWLRSAPAQRLVLGNLHIDAPKVERALWVVDGQQRITSLANALHPKAATDPKFALGYDLENKAFNRLTTAADPAVVPLPVLFDLERLIEWFHDRPEMAPQLKHATSVARTIRQFKVPAYQVEQNDVAVLQDIFDRLNNYGKRLSKAEIFTALNAGAEDTADGKLTIPLIAENVSAERAFGVLDGDSILKAILARRNSDVLRDIRNEFAGRAGIEFPDEDRDTAYERAQDALLLAVEFLQEHAYVPHVAMLPYRNLLIVLARFFAHHPDPGHHNLRLLRRWFWRAAVIGPERFKGGTTGAIRALCAAVIPGAVTASLAGMLALVDSTAHPIPDLRRFRANEARTKITLCAWWYAEPRSVETGDVFDQAALADCLTDAWTASGAVRSVIVRRDTPEELRQYAANRVLMPPLLTADSEVAPILLAPPDGLVGHELDKVLDSHALSNQMLAMLRVGNYREFLIERHGLLRERLRIFLELMCEWGFEDTPALSELDLDDESEDPDDFAA